MRNPMNRLLAFLVCLTLLATLAPAAAAQPLRDPAFPELQLVNGDFESGTDGWTLTGLTGEIIDNSYSSWNATHVLNLWASNSSELEIAASYTVRLLPGSYCFTFEVDGEDADSRLYHVVSWPGAEPVSAGPVVTTGWDQWQTFTTETFELTETADVTFSLCGTAPTGYWGHLDNLRLYGTGGIYVPAVELDHNPEIAVPQVNGVDGSDFVRGADISSFRSLIQAGAQFYDYEGNLLDEAGFFQLLNRAGFNYVRIRVWVDPYDGNGNGYGGGNNDLATARYLAKQATDAGLRVMIDFHYSDFWADPGKQQAPKDWANYSLQEKADAIEEYTYNSLKSIKEYADGSLVDLVQIGNETTSGICGETGWPNMAQLFAAGARAVRRLDAERTEDTKVTVHFTNPEKTSTIKGFADKLNQYGVDYDVFATSWYPYWHGTTDNLTNVLKYVADTYDKEVLIAETSWAWTLADGDGWDNTVSASGNSANMPYPFTQQGQADELVAAARAVRAVGEKGLGVFYWENAWIPVQYAYDDSGALDPAILASNQEAWETFGCGWASSYAGEYQADAAQWHGGSAVDNQAMFDFRGKALDSLWTWLYMTVGTENLVEKRVESVAQVALNLDLGGSVNLPSTVDVTYNVGGTRAEPVTWAEADLAAVDVNTPGVYTVGGEVALSYDLGTLDVTATVSVNHPNLLRNFDFESSDLSMYAITGGYDWSTDTPHGGSRCLHFYNANGGTLDFSQTLTLEPGTYTFSFYAQGDAAGGTEQLLYVSLPGAAAPLTADFALAGWAVWQNPEISFTVYGPTEVTVGGRIVYGPGGWGTFDDLCLRKALVQEPLDPTEDPELIVNESLSIGPELTWYFSFRQALVNDYASWQLEISKLNADGEVLSTETFGPDDVETVRNVMYGLSYPGVSAKEMGLTLRVVLSCFDAAGKETRSLPLEDSIRAYLLRELMDPESPDALKTLTADILNYGAAAQVFFGFETNALVNENLTAEQADALAAWQTAEEAPARKTNSPCGPTLYYSVSVMNRVELALTCRVPEAQGAVTVRVVNTESGETVAELSTVPYNNRISLASFAEISGELMRCEFALTTLVDGAETGNTVLWSVEGYVRDLRQTGSAAEIALADAMLIYGDSAAAYLNAD